MLRAAVGLVAWLGAVTVYGAESSSGAAAATPAAPRAMGYLQAGAAPSSAALIPVPPAPGSAAMARDEDVSRGALAMHGTPRWELAAKDAVLTFPQLAETFSCALGARIDDDKTPRLMTLLRKTMVDAGRSTGEAKRKYQRTRPFMVNDKPMCTPDRDAALRADGSYPSGHSAVGWALALVLSEASPDEANAILARGRAFGQSRIVCNVHWQSDVLEGQMVASAVVARMHAEATFRSDMDAARAELVALRATPPQAQGQACDVEAQTLQSWR